MSRDQSSTDAAAADAEEMDSDDAGGDYLEKAIVVVSVLLIAGTLGYLAVHAVATPATATPTATVDAVDPLQSDDHAADHVRVTVTLDNRGSNGLTSVEVAVQCGATERSLLFTNVPASGERTGTVICPANTDPTASVTSWVEA